MNVNTRKNPVRRSENVVARREIDQSPQSKPALRALLTAKTLTCDQVYFCLLDRAVPFPLYLKKSTPDRRLAKHTLYRLAEQNLN